MDLMPEIDWKVDTATRDRLGESPLWNQREGALYWIDFYGPTVHRLFPASGFHESWRLSGAGMVGSIAFTNDGRLIVALDTGLKLFNPRDQSLSDFGDPNGGRDGIGYNDAKVDRTGRYWVGTYDIAENAPRGILYRVEKNGNSHVGDSGYVVCNGPAFSPSGDRLYFSDSMGRQLIAYDLDTESGRLFDRRIFALIDNDEGFPDGLTVDSEGCLWCSHYTGGRVTRFAPDGTPLTVLRLPVANVTSLCLGGGDLRTLFVTTGWSSDKPDVSKRDDGGGAVFSCRVEVPGLVEPSVAV